MNGNSRGTPPRTRPLLVGTPSSPERAELIEAARGTVEADLIIAGADVLDVWTGERYPATVATKSRWIVRVTRADEPSPPGRQIVDARGCVLVPGMIDAHNHIESSMLSVRELTRALLPRGITALTADPHELANVLGRTGIEALLAEARGLPMKVFLRVPPRVPALPQFETTGGALDDDDTLELLDEDVTISLAGDCNAQLVLRSDPVHGARIEAALARRLPVNGQVAGMSAADLDAFAVGGPQDSHLARTADEAFELLRRGLRALVNPMPTVFPRSEFATLAARLRSSSIDSRGLLFCFPDRHPSAIARDGHLDWAVRVAIEEGIPPLIAIQMASLNVAQHYRIDHLYGSVTPGRVADLLMLRDLDRLEIERVVADGRVVAEAGELLVDLPSRPYPPSCHRTIKLAQTPRGEALLAPAPAGASDRVRARAIWAGRPKRGEIVEVTASGGRLHPDPDRDIAAIAIVDRYSGTARTSHAFVTGLGIRKGAVASTVNHDSHNIVVVGVNEHDMAVAVSEVHRMHGGVAAVAEGVIRARVALPIAGLMSEEPFDEVARAVSHVEAVLKDEIGTFFDAAEPLMWLQTICVPNVGGLGMTDSGLFDVAAFETIETVVG
jgi:adenine deaminase